MKNKKFLFTLLTFILCCYSHCFASNFKYVKKLYKQKKYFTAAGYLKDLIKQQKYGKPYSLMLNSLIPNTGIYPFLDVSLKRLKRMKSLSNINYLIGKKHLFLKQDRESLVHFNKVKPSSPFYLSSQLHLASLYEIQNNFKKAKFFERQCMKNAKKLQYVSPYFDKDVSKINREYIFDLCESLIAKRLYKEGKLEKSSLIFTKIDNESFQFPFNLFYSSWPFFREKEYSASVGRNITYQAPLLDEYFIPETELVKTLSYLKLCQYDEAIEVIKNFQKNVTKPLDNFMTRFGLKSRTSEHAFTKILYDKELKRKLDDNFIYKMFRVLKRKPSIQTLNVFFSLLKQEKNLLKSKKDRKAYLKAKSSFTKFYNTYVKVKFVKYSKEIIRINNILSEVELDTYTFMKEKYYAQRDRKKSQSVKRFSVSNKINRRINQHLWNFHGEFWVDELGHYLPLLENRCVKKRKKK